MRNVGVHAFYHQSYMKAGYVRAYWLCIHGSCQPELTSLSGLPFWLNSVRSILLILESDETLCRNGCTWMV